MNRGVDDCGKNLANTGLTGLSKKFGAVHQKKLDAVQFLAKIRSCCSAANCSPRRLLNLTELIMTTPSFDFTKSFDFAKSGLDFPLFFAKTTFDGVERMALLNLAAARSVFDTAMSNMTALLGTKDFQAFINLQKEMASPSIEKGVEYSRNVIAIAAETKDKIAKEVETKVAETNAKVSGLVEKALASAPAGSEVAVAAVKTAIKSTNDAIEGMNKAAKQAAEVAEASVTAATKATIKAANVATIKSATKAA
jgi:phasin family protein